MSDLDLLRGLGDQIVPPPLDLLRQTARRRDRRTTMVLAAGSALAVTLATVLLLGRDGHSSPEPVGPPAPTSRPLTYAVGSEVHYGDDIVATSGAVLELDLTDDGVVVRTDDAGIWFTDGSGLDRLGTLGRPAAAFQPEVPYYYGDGSFVVSDNTGSLVGWFEFPAPNQPELVVYDTASRDEVARQPIELGKGHGALLTSVNEEFASWDIDPVPFEDPSAYGRLDLATGEQAVTAKQPATNAGPVGTPRTVLVSHQEGGGPPYEVEDGIHMQLGCCGHGGRNVRQLVPRGEEPLEVLDGATRTAFTFAMPRGYPDPDPIPGWLTQWIDNDTIVITFHDFEGEQLSDVLVCHVSTSACEIAGRSLDAVLPEIG
jgi:hypothetical protein